MRCCVRIVPSDDLITGCIDVVIGMVYVIIVMVCILICLGVGVGAALNIVMITAVNYTAVVLTINGICVSLLLLLMLFKLLLWFCAYYKRCMIICYYPWN